MSDVKLDFKYSGLEQYELKEYEKDVIRIHEEFYLKQNEEDQFLGWLSLPSNYDKEEFDRIKKAAKKIKQDSDVLVVIGIGGSYLGARAVIEALGNTFSNSISDDESQFPKVIFVGNNMSPNYINDVIEFIGDRDLSINVISKSGTTTEPAIAFRIFREYIENRYGLPEARSRIYVTTDKEKGALKQLADEEGYEKFVVPDNIGGRYSVLTAVGLLPIAAAGVNIDKLIAGALLAEEKYADSNLKYNECYQYAVTRNILYQNNKNIEILVDYEPKLHYIIEWWKQLFAESEGKEKKGILPISTVNTRDLHSLGQYLQDGSNIIFETVIDIDMEEDLTFSNISIKELNNSIKQSVLQSHYQEDTPSIVLKVGYDLYSLGQLSMFFMLAAVFSSYLLNINPFDQPGVEKYKNELRKIMNEKSSNALSLSKDNQ